MSVKIIVERLLEHWDPVAAIDMPEHLACLNHVTKAKPIPEHRPGNDRTNNYHLGRVHYFLLHLKNNIPIVPIEIDNQCHAGSILPYPIVIDGNHRLLASHLYSKATIQASYYSKATIQASYCGRLDVLRYLQGIRVTTPVE